MELGLSLPTKANSWEVCRRAEELGYSHAWFYDTVLLMIAPSPPKATRLWILIQDQHSAGCRPNDLSSMHASDWASTLSCGIPAPSTDVAGHGIEKFCIRFDD